MYKHQWNENKTNRTGAAIRQIAYTADLGWHVEIAINSSPESLLGPGFNISKTVVCCDQKFKGNWHSPVTFRQDEVGFETSYTVLLMAKCIRIKLSWISFSLLNTKK